MDQYRDLEKQLSRCYPMLADGTRHVVQPQVQNGGIDCGLFAVTTAFTIAAGFDPTNCKVDQSQLRQHLLECLECDVITAFPRLRSVEASSTSVDISFSPPVESIRLSFDVQVDAQEVIADASVTAGPALDDVQHLAHDVRIENTICDPTPMETDEQEDDSVVWTVVEASSRQRHSKLTSSSGYSYNVKRRNKNGTIEWQCCRRERRAGVLCRATVKQSGDVFVPGPSEHCHPPQANTTKVHTIRAAVVNAACDNLFKSAGKP